MYSHRKYFTKILCLLLLIPLLSACTGYLPISNEKPQTFPTPKETAPLDSPYQAKNYDSVKAMWLSQFDLYPICVQNGRQRPLADFLPRIQQMIDNITTLGINTIFVQVRPNGDSLYPSEIFPMSQYAVGRVGAKPEYDPFDMILRTAHNAKLSVHAWINPLRCFSSANRKNLTEEYLLVRWCETDYMREIDGMWYLNPAYGEVHRLIADGIREILEKYPVDGIHMDDYFYPTADPSFDDHAYGNYIENGGTFSLSDFRRASVNKMVATLYQTVKSKNKSLLFGISPGGNTQRNYHELYADVAAWCKNSGYVDYICPQLYFGFEHATVPFDRLCEEFSQMTKAGYARLIIGMTLGKAYNGFYGIEDAYAGSGRREWIENTDILYRSLTRAAQTPNCDGVAYFSYQFFYSPENGRKTEATARECESFLPLLKTTSFPP